MEENKKTPSMREKENEKCILKLVNADLPKRKYRVKTIREGEKLSSLITVFC